MGKPKKGKKGKQDDDFGDDEVDIDVLAAAEAADEVLPQKTSKQKKGKKNKKDNWDGDDDDMDSKIQSLTLDSGDDDIDAEFSDENILPQKQKKKDKKKAKKKQESDDEEAEVQSMKKPAGMSGFAMLDMEEDSMGSSENEEKVENKAAEGNVIKREDSTEDKEQEAKTQDGENNKQKQQKKGKKDKKKKKNEEEDIDALLAEIEGKTAQSQGLDFKDSSAMTQEELYKAMEAEYEDDEDKKKKKTKKKKAGKESTQGKESTEGKQGTEGKESAEGKESIETEENSVTDDTEPTEAKEDTEMTAAQKKKEKKERQKQKKAEEKAKQKDKKVKKEDSTETQPKEDGMEEVTMEFEEKQVEEKQVEKKQVEEKQVEGKQVEEKLVEEKQVEENQVKEKQEGGPEENTAEGETVEQPEEEGDEDSKKKKKKDRKKKKGEKEEEKESKKKTSKMGKLILEQQKMLREEEERIRVEMEEKEQRIDEARRLKEEKEVREKERKEREKQKKKEKIERQKKEGTYLTAKQKEAQRIAQQKLEAMIAQGYEVPSEEPVKKKRPVYDSKKKKKQEVTSQSSQEKEDEKPAVLETVELEDLEKEKVKDISEGSKEEEVKVILEGSQEKEVKNAADEEEDVKDAWDEESEEEIEPEKPVEEPVERSVSVDKEEESGEESEDDEAGSSEEEEDSSEEDSEEESSSEDEVTAKENAREKAMNRMRKMAEVAEKNKSTDRLRAAVVCVLGHVDTGKTKILDKLRKTNVQDNEAGGITQQIGATNVPESSIKDSTKMCKEFSKQELKLPGLLIIDTPGHESFSNLRTRGSSLCDIAILVVDIMHGLEAQTIESINLLKQRKCPFIVALNKVDRLFQWQSNPHSDIINVLKKQKVNTKQEFDERATLVKTQLSEQGLNAELFFDNKNPKEYISLVPTSAHSGDGMGNLIALICELTQNHLAKKLAYSEHLEATVMEVKALPGLGTTIDVILVNGTLYESDTIIVPGTEGPIVTQIRGLLMPQPMKELRVKNAYVHHKEVAAAQGIKIIAKDLDHSLAGLPIYVAKYADEIDIYKERLEDALEDILGAIKLQDRGVFVQASTLGSMEALLKYLKDSEIPYSGINIGPVHRRDVMKASVMLDRDPQYAVILAFDVKVERDANDMAESLGIRIFSADIIYHLFDSFMDYRAKYKKDKQDEFKNIAVFPCKLRVLPQYIFNSRDPIVVGVIVEAGFVKLGTPLCVPSKENILLGIVTSIEVNHKQIEKAYKGQEVCIKIENIPSETPKLYGRHFEHTDLVISKITRDSIDAVKNYFRDEMTKADWQVMIELKKLYQIL